MSSEPEKAFEYWVNVYPGFIDIGGDTREEADRNNQAWVEYSPDDDGFRRLDCRLLRYTPGIGIKDITPKRIKRRRNLTPQEREARAERLRRLHAAGRLNRKGKP